MIKKNPGFLNFQGVCTYHMHIHCVILLVYYTDKGQQAKCFQPQSSLCCFHNHKSCYLYLYFFLTVNFLFTAEACLKVPPTPWPRRSTGDGFCFYQEASMLNDVFPEARVPFSLSNFKCHPMLLSCSHIHVWPL